MTQFWESKRTLQKQLLKKWKKTMEFKYHFPWKKNPLYILQLIIATFKMTHQMESTNSMVQIVYLNPP